MEEGTVMEGFLEEVMLIRDTKHELIGHHVNQGQSAYSGESRGDTGSHFGIPKHELEPHARALSSVPWHDFPAGLRSPNTAGQRIINSSASPNTKCHHGRIWAYGPAAALSAQADLAPADHSPGPPTTRDQSDSQAKASEHWGSRFAQGSPWSCFSFGRK